MSYPEPKLIEESKYDSVCALCANEIPKGAPLWWFDRNCYCMEHSKAEIRTEGAAPSHPADNPSPNGPPSTLRFDVPEIELRELNKNLDRIVAAIDLQTDILKGMRKDNNERR
jgi:hypothetical protein